MNDLVRCYRCSALYKPGNWLVVRDLSRGTTAPPEFVRTAAVAAGDCPVCGKPPMLEPPAKVEAM